jgi:hypothetical protein
MTKPVEVQASIGGRALTFKWCWTAVVSLQDVWDLKSEKELEQRMLEVTNRDFPLILWALAQKNHPEITEPQMLDLMDDTPLDDLAALIRKVISQALPPKKAKAAPPPT